MARDALENEQRYEMHIAVGGGNQKIEQQEGAPAESAERNQVRKAKPLQNENTEVVG